MATTLLRTEYSQLNVYDVEPHICDLMRECVELVDLELDVKPEIRVFGKVCHQQRSVGFYSNESKGYNYSTTLTPSKAMYPPLIKLLEYVNIKFQYDYNGILINKYSGGQDYIGKHSDDERGIDSRVGVISLSYGEVRKFRIRNKATGKIEVDVPTDPSKIIQMAGSFQREFTHEIPVEKTKTGVRYSFTFRKHTI